MPTTNESRRIRPSQSARPADGLNDEQRAAVNTLFGPMLVLAGAGTGKTRVITHRIVQLIRSGVAPDRILSVTFTNKAAKEMQERTADLIGRRLPAKPFISTFHSLCVRILREEIEHLGYPSRFQIMDRGDQESAARRVLRDIRVTEKSLRPGDLLGVISRWKSAGVSAERAADASENDQDFLAAMGYRRYQEQIRASGAVDFDDLLLLTDRLFTEFPDVLERQQAKFDHVQIDEYQDTNGIQFRLIAALVQQHRNLCVVGDDDQAIYGWRGAEVRHILGFNSHFPEAKVFRLEDNYRCTDRILELANRLVRHNKGRHPKTLRAHKTSTQEVRVLEYPDEQQEAEKVVLEIRFLSQKRDVPYRDIAILFRTNEQPRMFEAEMRRTGVPYVLIGSQSFYDRKEIRDMLSYLKVMSHPQDEASLFRIINVPARGIGAKTVEKLQERAVREGRSFWDVVHEARQSGELPAKANTGLQDLEHLLHSFRRRFEESPRQMEHLMRELIDTIHYESEIERQYKDPQQQLARTAVIDEFVESLGEYVQSTARPSLDDYLTSITLEGRDEEPDKEAQAAENAVKLMTMHSAKGLEFPRVYMVGMEEGLLPHKRSVDATEKEIEEERRLAYVGVTRAKDVLTFTRAATRRKWGKVRESVASRFLFEMFDEAFAPIVVEDEPEE
ncbi:MAG: UvrD-helicase domain-containing protein [Planctomycetaceae bacterium]|nr:UvrD-helicase domain-containing protein [Planctomycetaceae bacterium]